MLSPKPPPAGVPLFPMPELRQDEALVGHFASYGQLNNASRTDVSFWVSAKAKHIHSQRIQELIIIHSLIH